MMELFTKVSFHRSLLLKICFFLQFGGFLVLVPGYARRHGKLWTSPTRTKLAENLWNTFEHLRATWICVESRSLLVTRHEPSTFPKNGIKNATIFFCEPDVMKRTKKFHFNFRLNSGPGHTITGRHLTDESHRDKGEIPTTKASPSSKEH